MHQTFYIDIDEEITSIVDRLKKSKAREVVVVVPKRAILIQSIINLKLLKKEADSLKKELIIVTQDKFGKMLIEKAGITVEQKLDDITGQEISNAEINEGGKEDIKINLDSHKNNPSDVQAKRRLDNLGSDGYHQSENFNLAFEKDFNIKEQAVSRKNREAEGEAITNKELVVDMGNDLKEQQASFKQNAVKSGSYAPMDMIRNIEIFENDEIENKNNKDTKIIKKSSAKNSNKLFKIEEIEDEKYTKESADERAGEFFKHQKEVNNHNDINLGGGLWKYFFTFSLIAVAVIIGIVAYIFLPKASVLIIAKNNSQTIDAQIVGSINADTIDIEKRIIPAKIVTISNEATKEYSATGAKNSSNQKAHGKIVIYNEFGVEPQPLVATTRFETADKKIFRLVAGVTIPGAQKVGAEIKPGTVEAEVVADESGEVYNIEATAFTIPGFQSSGNEKYSKIYAKSFKAMIGGGQGDKLIRIASNTDIDLAKVKITQELRSTINQKLKEEIGDENVFLDDAINIDNTTYSNSISAGDIADKFSLTANIKASAIVFKKSDAKNILAALMTNKNTDNMKIAEDSIDMEFGKSDANFKDGTITIRAHSVGNLIPNIDLQKLKNDILGKQEDELRAYLSSYSGIGQIEINYWPSFIAGKIPNYASRVEVTLDKN